MTSNTAASTPEVFRVPSPGDGKYLEQIEVNGTYNYALYQPGHNGGTAGISYENFHIKPNEDKILHLLPLKNPLWLFAGEPSEPGDLWYDVKGYIYRHVDFPNERLYDVATAWVFVTWIPEAFSTAPYFRLYGAKGTGKTRVLEVFQHLCYRAMLTPSATESALFRLIQDYHVTFLLDESEIYGTDTRKSIQGILNGGYRRGSQVLRTETAADDSFIVSGFGIYGPKALAGTELLKDTLESRCIPVVMQRSAREVNYDVDTREAKNLRSRLLLWRFRRLADLDQIGDVSDKSGILSLNNGDGCDLRHYIKDSRVVEIFTPLLRLAEPGEALQNIFSYAQTIYEETVEEEATSYDAQIVTAIQGTSGTLESGKFSVNEVTDYFNADKPDQEKWDSRGIGRVVKRLGFKPKRLTGGLRGYLYDAVLVKQLLDRYDLPTTTVDVTNGKMSLSSLTLDDLHNGTMNHGKTASQPLKLTPDLAVGVSGG